MKRMMLLAAVLTAALLVSCTTPPAPVGQAEPAIVEEQPFVLTVLHVGDTHSKMEPTQARFTLDRDESLKGKAVYVELGGFPNLMSAVQALRSQAPNPLFPNAGDMSQGTPYFTQFLGAADRDFWNLRSASLSSRAGQRCPPGVVARTPYPAGRRLRLRRLRPAGTWVSLELPRTAR